MTEKELEKKISEVYDTAAREMEAKTAAYLERYKSNLSEMQGLLQAGDITQAEYNEWINKQVIINTKWQAQSRELAYEALQADNTAKSLIAEELPAYFAEGMNYGTFEVETLFGVDTSFSLYNKQNVLSLIKDEPRLLPQLSPESPTEKATREGKIIRWNQQKITQQVTQGLIQGESIPKIAKRLQTVTDMDKRAAQRNARTATNAARQAGHDASYERAQELGIEVQRMWIAALDDRTRQEHRELDMQVRPVGEPFRVDGYEIMYPCDPSAEPEMVYNCRCDIVAYNPKMDISLADRNTSKLEQDYEEWKAGKTTENSTEDSKPEPAVENNYADLSKASNSATNEWFAENSNYTEWKENIFDKEYDDSIYKYTGEYYSSVNDYLRTDEFTAPNKWFDEGDANQMIKELDESIAAFDLKEPITVYRSSSEDILGVNGSSLEEIKGAIGTTVSDKAYLSTSTLKELPDEQTAGGKIQYEIGIPAGQGNGAYIQKYSENPQEREFLLKRGGDYMVLDAQEIDGQIVVFMQML